jgi:hypothetical protein
MVPSVIGSIGSLKRERAKVMERGSARGQMQKFAAVGFQRMASIANAFSFA